MCRARCASSRARKRKVSRRVGSPEAPRQSGVEVAKEDLDPGRGLEALLDVQRVPLSALPGSSPGSDVYPVYGTRRSRQRENRYRGEGERLSQRSGGSSSRRLSSARRTSARSRWRRRASALPSGVVVEARAGLGAEVAALDPLAEDRRGALLAAELRRQVVDHAAPDVEPSQVDHLHRPQERPANARPLGQDRVDVLGRGHAGLEEVQGLPHQRRLQPVGHESRHVPAEEHGALADGRAGSPSPARPARAAWRGGARPRRAGTSCAGLK